MRKKIFVYLEIDTLLRRAELLKHIGDLEYAISDFKLVIELCKKFPEKNESTQISALFSVGKIQMDLQKLDEAQNYFELSLEMFKL